MRLSHLFVASAGAVLLGVLAINVHFPSSDELQSDIVFDQQKLTSMALGYRDRLRAVEVELRTNNNAFFLTQTANVLTFAESVTSQLDDQELRDDLEAELRAFRFNHPQLLQPHFQLTSQ